MVIHDRNVVGQHPSSALVRDWPLVKAHLAQALGRHRDVGSPAVDRPRRRPAITVRLGGPENFAHLVWNTFGALSREQALGTLPALRRVVTVGSEYFGAIGELYPELDRAQVRHRDRGGITGRHIDDPTHLLLPLGTSLQWPDAFDRVCARADRAGEEDPDSASLRDRVATFRQRLYVGLRVGDKSWADAAQELPSLIDAVHRRHPDAIVLLDGFSRPAGADHVTPRWARQQRELADLVTAITARVADPDRVVSMLGLDLLGSIAVLRTATCYLTPLGTAHHKVDWFRDIPGVVYTPAETLHTDRAGWPGFLQRATRSQLPRVVAGTDLGREHVRIQRAGDGRATLRNFTLDWRRVWAELAPLLGPESSRRRRWSRWSPRVLGR
ncbi:MAG: hypothetical protein QM638_17230 [Nocardioides sp.]|uniref:hypothetical protein n=1 Tax=Nocardioides sp. TaxID=35761 RepID=UPI0039E4638B